VNKALDQFGQAGVLVSTPASTGVVSGRSVQLVAGENIAGVAKGDASWSVWKRFTVAAHDVVSLFTQKGMSLIASAGAVVVQAQRGRMQLAAQEDMTVETVNGVVQVKSPREIVLNVGGSYLRMTPAGIEMGTRGGVLFRTGSLKKTGPAQMDLGGEAFAPQFVPYTTQCEVWRTNPDFVPALAAAAEMENTGAVPSAPSLDAGAMQPAGGGDGLNPGSMEAIGQPLDRSSAATGDGSGSDVDLTVSDPENAPKDLKIPAGSNGKDGDNYVVPSITLGKPAPCNWAMEDFSQLSAHDMEVKAYYPWIDEKTKYERKGKWSLTPGSRKSKFDIRFDNNSKMLTASVKIGVILKDIHEIDSTGNDLVRLKDGTIKSVPYDSTGNGANVTDEARPKNLKFVDRDSTKYDFAAKAKLINSVMNQNSYKLILDGCAKGPQCGCRVSIQFDVAFFVIKESERLFGPYHSVINLYPYAFRDDSGNWGEVVAKFDASTNDYTRWLEDYTAAHECGHLFNYPDEYFRESGSVHEQYIEKQHLQFERGRQLAGSETWQMVSRQNLMGSGSRNKVSVDPLPQVPPYYMEYLRRWMTKHTSKKWRVGVNVA
jgi:type VI secretion system secreted protein VgrG